MLSVKLVPFRATTWAVQSAATKGWHEGKWDVRVRDDVSRRIQPEDLGSGVEGVRF